MQAGQTKLKGFNFIKLKLKSEKGLVRLLKSHEDVSFLCCDFFNFFNGILVSERRWSAHQCWWALEWLKSPILEWQSLLQLEQM